MMPGSPERSFNTTEPSIGRSDPAAPGEVTVVNQPSVHVSPATPVPAALKTVAVLLLATGVLTIAYWVVYFTSGAVQAESSEIYIAFENAFPAADGWMCVACFLAAVGLWRGRSSGFLFGAAAGSAMIFLGLMDVLFNLEQNMYALGGMEMAIETVINIWTLGFGSFVIWFVWARRRSLADW